MIDMADLSRPEDFSPRRSFIRKEMKRTNKIMEKVIGNGPGNGFPPLQPNESPEDDVTTALTQSYQDSKEGTKGGAANCPQIIYGNYRHGQTSFQIKVYNFLERPTGWKCFAYHFTVEIKLDVSSESSA